MLEGKEGGRWRKEGREGRKERRKEWWKERSKLQGNQHLEFSSIFDLLFLNQRCISGSNWAIKIIFSLKNVLSKSEELCFWNLYIWDWEDPMTCFTWEDFSWVKNFYWEGVRVKVRQVLSRGRACRPARIIEKWVNWQAKVHTPSLPQEIIHFCLRLWLKDISACRAILKMPLCLITLGKQLLLDRFRG